MSDLRAGAVGAVQDPCTLYWGWRTAFNQYDKFKLLVVWTCTFAHNTVVLTKAQYQHKKDCSSLAGHYD